MKRLLLFLLISTILSPAIAQKRVFTFADWPIPIDSVTGEVYYKGAIDVPGATSDQLYARAKTFFFKQFINAKEVVQVEDRPGGMIAGS